MLVAMPEPAVLAAAPDADASVLQHRRLVAVAGSSHEDARGGKLPQPAHERWLLLPVREPKLAVGVPAPGEEPVWLRT